MSVTARGRSTDRRHQFEISKGPVSPSGPLLFGTMPHLHFRTECRVPELLLLCESGMASPPKSRSAALDVAAHLAERLSESLVRERLVPRFVDSYVVEHGRYGLQVHAPLYRDLLALLQREALLASSARALDIVSKGGIAARKLQTQTDETEGRPFVSPEIPQCLDAPPALECG